MINFFSYFYFMCSYWPLSSESPRGVSCSSACSGKGREGAPGPTLWTLWNHWTVLCPTTPSSVSSGQRTENLGKKQTGAVSLGHGRGWEMRKGSPSLIRDFDLPPLCPGNVAWLFLLPSEGRTQTHTRVPPAPLFFSPFLWAPLIEAFLLLLG